MSRVLSVARARVEREHQDEYLALMGDLTREAERAGRHCWMFRSREDPSVFLEFREAASASLHAAGMASLAESRIERRLRELARYEPGRDEVWEEVRCPDASSK